MEVAGLVGQALREVKEWLVRTLKSGGPGGLDLTTTHALEGSLE